MDRFLCGLRLINSMSPIPFETFESKFRIIQTDFALQPTLPPNGPRRSRTAHVIGRTAPQNYTLLLRCHRSKGGKPPRVESGHMMCHVLYSPAYCGHSWFQIPGGIPLRDPAARSPPRARPARGDFHPPVFLAFWFWDTGLSNTELPLPRGMRKDRKANYKQPIPGACI